MALQALCKCPNTMHVYRFNSGFSDLLDFDVAYLLDLPLTVTSLEVTLSRRFMHYDN